MSKCRCVFAGHGAGLWHGPCTGRTHHGAALCDACKLAGCNYNRKSRKVWATDYWVKPPSIREQRRAQRAEWAAQIKAGTYQWPGEPAGNAICA